MTGITSIKECGVVESEEACIDPFDGYGGFGD